MLRVTLGDFTVKKKKKERKKSKEKTKKKRKETKGKEMKWKKNVKFGMDFFHMYKLNVMRVMHINNIYAIFFSFFYIQTVIKKLLTKYFFFMKLPQISHRPPYENRNFLGQLVLPIWQRHVKGIILFQFGQLYVSLCKPSSYHRYCAFSFSQCHLLQQLWQNVLLVNGLYNSERQTV